MRIALKVLKQVQLNHKVFKCEFWLYKVNFLDHVVSKDGVSIDIIKIEAINDWKAHTLDPKLD